MSCARLEGEANILAYVALFVGFVLGLVYLVNREAEP
jgi:hypothetical protein